LQVGQTESKIIVFNVFVIKITVFKDLEKGGMDGREQSRYWQVTETFDAVLVKYCLLSLKS